MEGWGGHDGATEKEWRKKGVMMTEQNTIHGYKNK